MGKNLPTCPPINLILKIRDDVVLAVNKLTTDIQSVIYNSSKPTMTLKRHLTNLTLPEHTRTLRTEENHARRTWQRTRYHSGKKRLNSLSRKLQNELHKLFNDRFAHYTKSLNPDYPSLWTATKRILSHPTPLHSVRKDDNTWAI